jgi:hypothetical protein
MSLQAFKDFLTATREKTLSGPNEISNQATKYRSTLLAIMLAGLTPKEYVQSGQKVVDFIRLSSTNNYRQYSPTDTFNYTGTNSLTKLEVPWTFAMTYATWFDHEILLNSGGDLATVFKTIKRVKEQEMMTGLYEGIEDGLWATPDKDTMENPATTGLTPKHYSLRSFITDDGGAPSSTNGGVSSAGNWTTVMSVNPSTLPNWKNQTGTYDPTSAASAQATIRKAFDLMWQKLQWRSPGNSQEYFTDTDLSKLRILASMGGITQLLDILNQVNNRLEPFNNLQAHDGKVLYAGMPITMIDAIGTVDSSYEATAYKFKYRFVNFKHIKPIFHSQRYMFPMDMDGGAAQPQAHVMWRDTWLQLWCQNRREQGIVTAG